MQMGAGGGVAGRREGGKDAPRAKPGVFPPGVARLDYTDKSLAKLFALYFEPIQAGGGGSHQGRLRVSPRAPLSSPPRSFFRGGEGRPRQANGKDLASCGFLPPGDQKGFRKAQSGPCAGARLKSTHPPLRKGVCVVRALGGTCFFLKTPGVLTIFVHRSRLVNFTFCLYPDMSALSRSRSHTHTPLWRKFHKQRCLKETAVFFFFLLISFQSLEALWRGIQQCYNKKRIHNYQHRVRQSCVHFNLGFSWASQIQ